MAPPIDRPNGLRVVGTISGSAWTGAIRPYSVDVLNAAAIFKGSPVTLEADGNITAAAAGGIILGIAVAIKVDEDVSQTIAPGYLPATTVGTVMVAIGPDLIYEAQEDGVVSTLALTDVGANLDIIVAAGSTVTGIAAVELDSSSITAAGSAQFRLIEKVDHPENDIGNVGTRWRVRLNTVESHLGTANGI